MIETTVMSNRPPATAPATTVGALFRDSTLPARLAAVGPHGYDAGRLVRQAVIQFRANPALRATAPDSVLIALSQIAQLGLQLAGGEAYLIPRKSKKTGTLECTLQIGVAGWTSLALRTGRVVDIDATVVYGKDAFKVRLGGGFFAEHEPCLDDDRGAMKGVYAIAQLASGGQRGIWLSKADVLAIKAKADPDSPAWRDFPAMMWRKCAVKRLARLLAAGAPLLNAANEVERTAAESNAIDITVMVDEAPSDVAGTGEEVTDEAASLGQPTESPAPNGDPGPAKAKRAAPRATPMPTPIAGVDDAERRLSEASTLDAVDLVVDQCRQLAPELQQQVGALANARREALRADARA